MENVGTSRMNSLEATALQSLASKKEIRIDEITGGGEKIAWWLKVARVEIEGLVKV